jgi:transcriptional regulator GlxA family with amidase domain
MWRRNGANGVSSIIDACDEIPPVTFSGLKSLFLEIVDTRVEMVVEFLEARWSSGVRVAELADHVGLGASRLEHLFKQEARISIRDYIRERRLSAAAQLLAGSDERVSVISFRVGFQHVANFNHAFKRRFGVSPRAYRAAQSTGGPGPLR